MLTRAGNNYALHATSDGTGGTRHHLLTIPTETDKLSDTAANSTSNISLQGAQGTEGHVK